MKRFLIITGSVLAALAAGASFLRYQTAGKKTVLFEIPSEDGVHTLIVYMIGEPDFPFGSVTCEAALFSEGKCIRSETFTMPNDGKIPDESSIEVFWQDDSVTVIAHPEEADDRKFVLSFE